MPKQNKPFVKFTITGYVPAPDVLDRNSFERFHKRRAQIEALSHDNLEMCEVNVKAVNKQVETKPETSGEEE